MDNAFALELKSTNTLDLNVLETCYYEIYKFQPMDETEMMFVFNEIDSIKALTNYLRDFNCVEDIHELVLFEEATIDDRFYDYGWKGKFYYLFRDLVQPFQIVGGEDIQIKMAKLQIEEDLIAHNTKEEIFFVDCQTKSLIEGYAAAYNITVEFL